jgi:hypothetical protein
MCTDDFAEETFGEGDERPDVSDDEVKFQILNFLKKVTVPKI